jgi:DNA-binding CsgD family transcriptional regulator
MSHQRQQPPQVAAFAAGPHPTVVRGGAPREPTGGEFDPGNRVGLDDVGRRTAGVARAFDALDGGNRRHSHFDRATRRVGDEYVEQPANGKLHGITLGPRGGGRGIQCSDIECREIQRGEIQRMDNALDASSDEKVRGAHWSGLRVDTTVDIGVTQPDLERANRTAKLPLHVSGQHRVVGQSRDGRCGGGSLAGRDFESARHRGQITRQVKDRPRYDDHGQRLQSIETVDREVPYTPAGQTRHNVKRAIGQAFDHVSDPGPLPKADFGYVPSGANHPRHLSKLADSVGQVSAESVDHLCVHEGELMSDDVLSPSAMALYERLITTATMPIEPGTLDDPAVQELLRTGFAELAGDSQTELVPIPPVTAFERVLTDLQAEFLDQQRQLLEAYTYLDGLQQRFLETQPASDADSLARIRPDAGAFAEEVAELTASAKSEIWCWNIKLEHSDDANLRVRTVYDTAFLQREDGSAVLREARAAGEELRIADELASSMLIVDETAVALPLASTSGGAVVVRSPLVVNAMREFFEMIWQRSVPWIDRENASENVTAMQRQVVALMAVGHSDEEIAGHLGVSLRTVRRHVGEIMEFLQASTRFAAGIAAARAGLLDDTPLPARNPHG